MDGQRTDKCISAAEQVLGRLEDTALDFLRLMEEGSGSPETKRRDVRDDCYVWTSSEKQVLLKSESAVELGGGSLPAVSGVLYLREGTEAKFALGTDDPDRPGEQAVILRGRDLPELSGDVPFARVMLVWLKEAFLDEEYKLYRLLQGIDYTRYHVEPTGYMPRISTALHREQVRVSKEAIQNGLDFFKVGRVYGDAYRRHPAAARVETFFVTDEAFGYKKLQELFKRQEQVIQSLEHPLDKLQMDCAVCNLKPICDEIERSGVNISIK